MAGLNANSVFYNVTTTIAMLAGRYGLAALALALAGRFAAQRARAGHDRDAAKRYADLRRVGFRHDPAGRSPVLLSCSCPWSDRGVLSALMVRPILVASVVVVIASRHAAGNDPTAAPSPPIGRR